MVPAELLGWRRQSYVIPDALGLARRETAMNVILLIVSLALCATPRIATAEPLSAEKRTDILKLLENTGSADIGKQMAVAVVGQMTHAMKELRPDIPQRILDVLPVEVEAVFEENMASFVEIVVPIYHRYFTAAEIKELLRFYSTDLGKKAIRVMPALMNESMLAGQEWGRRLGPTIDQRVRARCKKEGYEL
jgi:hypothetical protein